MKRFALAILMAGLLGFLTEARARGADIFYDDTVQFLEDLCEARDNLGSSSP